MDEEQLNQYFKQFPDHVNLSYFKALWRKYKTPLESDLSLYHPESAVNSKFVPYALLEQKDLMPISSYSDLPQVDFVDVNLRLVKMHAGLGSSVERKEYLKRKTGREVLGAKGTDLYIGEDSLASLQLEQVKILNASSNLGTVRLQNLVNDETAEIVKSLYLENELVLPEIHQAKVPTIDEEGLLTTQRLAPSGHAFLGFYLLRELFQKDAWDEIIAIGNGEDLNSTPDLKILNWMDSHNVPICMITTTKTKDDLKGGQLGVVRESVPYIAIFEKAQAEKSGQLEYFQELGLREGDGESLFNTNIVLINTKVLKEKLVKLDISLDEFENIIAPDLIKNIKEQDGRKYVQLEGAIGSVMLNLDKFYRRKFHRGLIEFLNLNPIDRKKFFIPIKSMSDFKAVLDNYNYSRLTGRLEPK